MASVEALPAKWLNFRGAGHHAHNPEVKLAARDDSNVVYVYETVTHYATEVYTVDGSNPSPAGSGNSDNNQNNDQVVTVTVGAGSDQPAPTQQAAANPEPTQAAPVENSPAAQAAPVQTQAPSDNSNSNSNDNNNNGNNQQPPTPTTLSAVYSSSSPPASTPNPPSSGGWSDFSAPGSDGMFTFKPTALSYTPFDPNSGGCRSADQVRQDLQLLFNKGIREIRVYGTDCNSNQLVLPAAGSIGMTVVQGFYITAAGVNSIDNDVSDFVSWIQSGGDASIVTSITIGNEAIANGWASASDIVSKISSVRSQLQAVGYHGKFSTADIPSSFVNHPELCSSSTVDYVAVNAHPYFDPSTSASQAGEFIAGQLQQVQNACSGQYVRIVETGYPHSGNTNGNQVPSPENQGIAVTQIYNALKGDCILFSMWDDHWKNPGPYNVEWYFGIENHMS